MRPDLNLPNAEPICSAVYVDFKKFSMVSVAKVAKFLLLS
jgi:hypothetical protein